jgi:Uma2 family endonuclease
MATATLKQRKRARKFRPPTTAKRLKRVREFGPASAGILMTTEEFDQAEFQEGARYELINGVLVVSPIPSEAERDPNEELGHMLRSYRDTHPQGSSLNRTLPEHTIKTRRNRRRADRVIWANLGRLPYKDETPSIIGEFVSEGKRARRRDYEEKRDEYMEIRVGEYWVIDRFDRTMTVFTWEGTRLRERVIRENQVYTTPLLPGFELRLSELLARAVGSTEEESPFE